MQRGMMPQLFSISSAAEARAPIVVSAGAATTLEPAQKRRTTSERKGTWKLRVYPTGVPKKFRM